jgi:hypothetical protein
MYECRCNCGLQVHCLFAHRFVSSKPTTSVEISGPPLVAGRFCDGTILIRSSTVRHDTGVLGKILDPLGFITATAFFKTSGSTTRTLLLGGKTVVIIPEWTITW